MLCLLHISFWKSSVNTIPVLFFFFLIIISIRGYSWTISHGSLLFLTACEQRCWPPSTLVLVCLFKDICIVNRLGIEWKKKGASWFALQCEKILQPPPEKELKRLPLYYERFKFPSLESLSWVPFLCHLLHVKVYLTLLCHPGGFGVSGTSANSDIQLLLFLWVLICLFVFFFFFSDYDICIFCLDPGN